MSLRLKSKSSKFLLGTSTILLCAFLAAAFALSTLQNLEASTFASPASTGVDSTQENAFLDAMTVNTDTVSSAQAVLPLVTSRQKKLTEANNTSWLSLAPQMSRVDYAAQCQASMGRVPAFDCTAAYATVIPITGQENGKCDKPNQLGDGPCTPGSRTGQLSTGNPDVTTVFICRKYSAVADPTFHDIAVIQHNRSTGDTCWFQSKLDGSQHNGRTVPSPMDDTPTASNYWYEPANVASINCQRCHDADPFIWTPYIGQVFGQNPVNWKPKGPYNSNTFNIFAGQPQPRVFEPTDNSCVSCHRIGEHTVDGSGKLDLVHRSLDSTCGAGDDTCNKYDKNPASWMPVGIPLNTNHIKQLERCGANPTLAECNTHLPSSGTAEECISGAIYVNGAYTGAQQGSTTKPFKTVYGAGRAACAGAELHIRNGTYFEALTISKPLRLVAENGAATLFGSGSTNVIVAPDTPTSIISNDGNATVQIPPSSGINTVSVSTIAIDVGGSTLPAGSAPRSPVYDVTGSDQNNQPVTTLPGQIVIDISYADRGVTAASIAAETDLNVYRRTRNGDGSYNAWVPMLPCTDCVQDTTANRFTVQTNQLGQFTVLEAIAGMRITPPALNFTMVQSGANPTAQTLTIEKEGTGALEWSTIEVLPWLSLSLEAGNEPAPIQISVDGGSLAAGIYAGTIYIVQGVREIAIPVTLTMQASGTTPTPSQVYLPLVVR